MATTFPTGRALKRLGSPGRFVCKLEGQRLGKPPLPLERKPFDKLAVDEMHDLHELFS